MKKIIVLLFISLLLLSSCSGEPTQSNESVTNGDSLTEAPTEEKTAVRDSLPDGLKYDGTEFMLLAPDEYGGQSFVEAQIGEVLNDAQFMVELNVENRLDIAITEVPTKFWEMSNTVNSLIASNDSTYDSITMMDRFAYPIASSGYAIPINEIEYISLDNVYWGDKISEQLSVGGKNMFAVSSFNLRMYKKIGCVLMNTALADDCSVAPPYDLIDDGNWTLAKMQEISKGIYSDLNGDGIINAGDRFGLGAQDVRSITQMVWVGASFNTVQKDGDGVLYCAAHGNEKFVKIIDTVHEMFFTDDLGADFNSDNNFATTFKSGYELFSMAFLDDLNVNLRDMEDDFTVLPIPKFDEAQQTYVSRTYDTMFTMVPVTAEDTSFAGAVLEALSCEGYNLILPAYIQTSLQDKLTRDEYSPKYIKLAFDTRCIDLGEAFISDVFGDGVIYGVMKKRETNIASYLESKIKQINSSVETMNDVLSGNTGD